jgi:SPX domain protein involved in polyphosphate accumulation
MLPKKINLHYVRFDESFFTFCGKELTKINTFYAEKLAEATRKFATLKSEMEGSEYEQLTNKGHKKVQRRKVMDLKLAFSEFYLSLILLQNYQNLNFTGFRKILKKHDKLVKNDAGVRWREDYVECAHFHTNKAGAFLV